MHPETRRSILKSIATAGSLPLAGCQTPSTTTAKFDTVTTEGTNLIVTLDTSDGVDKLTVIGPDGEAFQTVDATAGQTKYTIDLGTAYTPGSYELNTVADDEVNASTSIELRPELSITEVGVGENHPDQLPEDLTFPESQILVSVENTGTGPDTITNLEITGNIPNPSKQEHQSESGIFATARGYGEVDKLVVGAGEHVQFFSSTHPFAGKSDYCQNGTFEVNLITNVSEKNVIQKYRIQYQDDSQDGCPVSIREAE